MLAKTSPGRERFVIRGGDLRGDLDLVVWFIGELVGPEADELVPGAEVLACSPAQDLAPEFVVVDIADAVAQSPGAIEVQREDFSEGVAVGRDQGVGRLQFSRRRPGTRSSRSAERRRGLRRPA